MSKTLKNAISYRRYNSGGPGGQHQNRTENAIMVELKPWAASELGIYPLLASASLKTLHESKKQAVKLLRQRIKTALVDRIATALGEEFEVEIKDGWINIEWREDGDRREPPIRYSLKTGEFRVTVRGPEATASEIVDALLRAAIKAVGGAK